VDQDPEVVGVDQASSSDEAVAEGVLPLATVADLGLNWAGQIVHTACQVEVHQGEAEQPAAG